MTAPLVGPYATPRRAQRTARRRDRRVYLRSHPVLFALLAATRRRPVVRIGRTVLVHGTEAYREVLTRVPLDRTAAGTTGGAAARLTDGGLLFDQDGAGHRAARRALSADLGSGAVARLRPLWQGVIDERLAVLDQAGPTRDGRPRDGRATVGLPAVDPPTVDPPTVDLVELARELAGVTTAALTACAADPLVLARAAADAAAATARDHLPGPRRPGGGGAPPPAPAPAAPGRTALLPPQAHINIGRCRRC
ncbi:hypothetical protein ACFVH7_00005, partial [Kitasatospora indigofera]